MRHTRDQFSIGLNFHGPGVLSLFSLRFFGTKSSSSDGSVVAATTLLHAPLPTVMSCGLLPFAAAALRLPLQSACRCSTLVARASCSFVG